MLVCSRIPSYFLGPESYWEGFDTLLMAASYDRKMLHLLGNCLFWHFIWALYVFSRGTDQ